jgi:hypothetical protein
MDGIHPVIAIALCLAGRIFFVDASSAGANDGTSWQDAFTDLQSALAVSGDRDEIWVARGTYKPTPSLDCDATFMLDCALYGGFDGSETSRDARAGLFDETILSGDLAGDDGPDFAGTAENSRTIVTVLSGQDPSMVLDGFTVRGARGDTPGQHPGGGLSMGFYTGDLTVRNCTFEENLAERGGGIGNPGKSRLRVEHCRFIENRARDSGGGVDGGMDTEIRGCTFLGNVAGRYGGGLEFAWLAVDCVFSGNTAGIAGGGANDTQVLGNCTLSGNEAPSGGGFAGGFPWSHLDVSNCILWGNRGTSGSIQAVQIAGFLEIDDSIVAGWDGRYPGHGTLDADPLFRDALGTDGIAGTLDDDLELEQGSPCVDTAATGTYAGDGFDAAGAARFVDALSCDQGGVLDRGALERNVVDGTGVYCASTPSSLGVPAEISGPCVVRATDGRIQITAGPVPSGSAFLLLGTPGIPRPFGDGILCLDGAVRRICPVGAGNGIVSFDLYTWGQVPGTPTGLQVRFRDPRPGGSGFNLSSAMRLVVLP